MREGHNQEQDQKIMQILKDYCRRKIQRLYLTFENPLLEQKYQKQQTKTKAKFYKKMYISFIVFILYLMVGLHINQSTNTFKDFILLAVVMLVILIIFSILLFIKKELFNLYHTVLMCSMSLLLALFDYNGELGQQSNLNEVSQNILPQLLGDVKYGVMLGVIMSYITLSATQYKWIVIQLTLNFGLITYHYNMRQQEQSVGSNQNEDDPKLDKFLQLSIFFSVFVLILIREYKYQLYSRKQFMQSEKYKQLSWNFDKFIKDNYQNGIVLQFNNNNETLEVDNISHKVSKNLHIKNGEQAKEFIQNIYMPDLNNYCQQSPRQHTHEKDRSKAFQMESEISNSIVRKRGNLYNFVYFYIQKKMMNSSQVNNNNGQRQGNNKYYNSQYSSGNLNNNNYNKQSKFNKQNTNGNNQNNNNNGGNNNIQQHFNKLKGIYSSNYSMNQSISKLHDKESKYYSIDLYFYDQDPFNKNNHKCVIIIRDQQKELQYEQLSNKYQQEKSMLQCSFSNIQKKLIKYQYDIQTEVQKNGRLFSIRQKLDNLNYYFNFLEKPQQIKQQTQQQQQNSQSNNLLQQQQTETFLCSELVDILVNQCHKQQHKRKVNLKVEYKNNFIKQEINQDFGLFELCVKNMVQNSIDHCPQNSQVNVILDDGNEEFNTFRLVIENEIQEDQFLHILDGQVINEKQLMQCVQGQNSPTNVQGIRPKGFTISPQKVMNSRRGSSKNQQNNLITNSFNTKDIRRGSLNPALLKNLVPELQQQQQNSPTKKKMPILSLESCQNISINNINSNNLNEYNSPLINQSRNHSNTQSPKKQSLQIYFNNYSPQNNTNNNNGKYQNNNNDNGTNFAHNKGGNKNIQIGLSICKDIVQKLGPEKRIEIRVDKKLKKISFSMVFYKDLSLILNLKPIRKRTELRKALQNYNNLKKKNSVAGKRNSNDLSISKLTNNLSIDLTNQGNFFNSQNNNNNSNNNQGYSPLKQQQQQQLQQQQDQTTTFCSTNDGVQQQQQQQNNNFNFSNNNNNNNNNNQSIYQQYSPQQKKRSTVYQNAQVSISKSQIFQEIIEETPDLIDSQLQGAPVSNMKLIKFNSVNNQSLSQQSNNNNAKSINPLKKQSRSISQEYSQDQGIVAGIENLNSCDYRAQDDEKHIQLQKGLQETVGISLLQNYSMSDFHQKNILMGKNDDDNNNISKENFQNTLNVKFNQFKQLELGKKQSSGGSNKQIDSQNNNAGNYNPNLSQDYYSENQYFNSQQFLKPEEYAQNSFNNTQQNYNVNNNNSYSKQSMFKSSNNSSVMPISRYSEQVLQKNITENFDPIFDEDSMSGEKIEYQQSFQIQINQELSNSHNCSSGSSDEECSIEVQNKI